MLLGWQSLFSTHCGLEILIVSHHMFSFGKDNDPFHISLIPSCWLSIAIAALRRHNFHSDSANNSTSSPSEVYQHTPIVAGKSH